MRLRWEAAFLTPPPRPLWNGRLIVYPVSKLFNNLYLQAVAPRSARMAVVPRAEYLGSATNQIMILSTALPLIAGRFGLAPTANRNASAGLKLSENKAAGLMSNDPAGRFWFD